MITVQPSADRAASLAMLERGARREVLGLAPQASDLVGTYPVFDVAQDGRPVGALAVGVHHFRAGTVVRCSVAGAEPGRDLVPVMARFLDDHAQANGARVITMETARRGLVRKLQAQGYEVAGFILRKVVA